MSEHERLVSKHGDEFPSHAIRYTVHSHWVDFRIWDVCLLHLDDGSKRVEYMDALGDAPSPQPEPPEGCFMSGTVKWDGCANVTFPELWEQFCMLHFCGPEEEPVVGWLMRCVYALAAETLDTWGQEAYPWPDGALATAPPRPR